LPVHAKAIFFPDWISRKSIAAAVAGYRRGRRLTARASLLGNNFASRTIS
jgi:hypothetical protein